MHHTTKRKNKTKLYLPNLLQKENAVVIYEKVLLAGAKFRIVSILYNLQRPKFTTNVLGKQLNLLENSPAQQARIHSLSPKIAVSWGATV